MESLLTNLTAVKGGLMPERKRKEPLLFWELSCVKALCALMYVCQGDFFSKKSNRGQSEGDGVFDEEIAMVCALTRRPPARLRLRSI